MEHKKKKEGCEVFPVLSTSRERRKDITPNCLDLIYSTKGYVSGKLWEGGGKGKDFEKIPRTAAFNHLPF